MALTCKQLHKDYHINISLKLAILEGSVLHTGDH